MYRTRAFTIYEVIAVVLLVAVLLFFVFSSLPRHRGGHVFGQNVSHLRGIHMSAVVFATANNSHLPGLDSHGELIADGPETGNSGTGDTAAARFWIMLNGQFIGGDLLVAPFDPVTRRVPNLTTSPAVLPPLTTANFSYAALSIAGSDTNGRRQEWKENADPLAVMLSDRNIGSSNADAQVMSFWTNKPGDWRGHMVWGDNHVEYQPHSHRGLSTRYLKTTQTNDNLFATVASPGVTENSPAPDSNAFMEWN